VASVPVGGAFGRVEHDVVVVGVVGGPRQGLVEQECAAALGAEAADLTDVADGAGHWVGLGCALVERWTPCVRAQQPKMSASKKT